MRTQKQRIFSFLVLLTIMIVLTCIFVACDKGGAQDKNYTVTIHPDNGQADFVWDTKTDIPVITKYGYHIVGFYLDEDMTISTTFESLKATNLTADLTVYVKWEKDSVPPKTKIVTNNLLCNYDTRTLSGKVSNSTTVFSFNDEISVEKGATYTISTDINGINVIPSKTVNLEIGDNVFYILVSNDDELTLYTATVRRKPIYTVTFDTLGGTEVEAQQVEEDDFATAPTTEKIGCTFENWDWDFSTPITENTTVTAIWNAFVYNIVYDFNIPEDSVSQEVDNSMNPKTYTVDDSVYFSAPRRNGYYFTGWSISKIVKGTTGTVTTTAQWSPITYEIIYDFNDENSVSKAKNNALNPRYYHIDSEITFAEPTRAGYSFVSWNKNIEKGTTGTQTITASWSVIDYDIVYNFGDVSSASKAINNELNPATYTIEDEIVFSEPTRAGYKFLSWDKNIIKGMTNEQTITASWSIIDYDITYDLGDADSVSKATNNDSNPTTYTVEDEIVFETPTRQYYEFVEWSKTISKGSVGNQNIVAVWKAETHTITYVLNNWNNAASNKNTYTIEDQTFALFDGISGEKLFCGWYLDDEYTNYIETIDASSMKDYIVYAMPDCGATKGLLIENGVVKSYLGLSTNVIIPSYYKGDTVVSIGNSAFNNCANLMSVTIPDQVISVGNSAFSGCSGLTKITGPSDMVSAVAKQCNSTAVEEIVITSGTSIGDSAFSSCSGLISVTILDSVTSIGRSAFNGCSSLTSVTISDSVASIGSLAFDGCTNLQNIYIADIVAWCNISGLDWLMEFGTSNKNLYLRNELVTSVTIPVSVTSIGRSAFNGCSSLMSITIPDSVTDIGIYAFRGCSGLTSVTIPISVTNVGNSAFSGCTGLTKIIGPSDTVSTVAKQCDSKAFEVVITSGTSIGDSAFSSCSGLISVTIPNSATIIGNYAFSGCDSLQNIYIADISAWCNISGLDNLMRYGASNKKLYLNNEFVTSLTIPDEVTAIPSYAFYGCESIVSVTIPDSVTSVGSSSFYGCNGLAKITGPSDTVSTVANQCNSIAFEVVITSGTSISDSAFSYCSGLTSVTIPNSVTSIGNYAFSGCDNLQNIYIADISAWCIISGLENLMRYGANNKNLYLNNELVTSLTIPDGVTAIPSYAFNNCIGFSKVTIANSVTSVDTSAFSGCSGIAKITGHSNAVSVVAKQCDSKAVESIVITSGTSIGDSAFSMCSGLISVTIPEDVADIGSYAFSGCDSLQNIYITNIVAWCNISGLDNLMRYGTSNKNLYLNNELVTSLAIPDGVNTIPTYAFNNCIGLSKVTVANSVTTVENYAFSGCNGLTKITGTAKVASAVAKQCKSNAFAVVLTSGVSIDNSAFSGCSGLTSITIPNSVTSIGSSAFYGCSNLQDINLLDIVAWCNISGLDNLMRYGLDNKNLYLNNELVTTLIIPDGVTAIPSYAFRGCVRLAEVTIGIGVTSIGDFVFYNCVGLTSIAIPDSVISVGGNAFYDCICLTDVTIDNSATSIGNNAFAGCSGLNKIAGSSKVASSIAKQCCSMAFEVVITSGTSIENSAFSGCDGLTNVTIGNSVTSIGGYSFSNCTMLTSVTIGNNITSISSSAFSNCSSLITVNWNATSCTSAGSAVYTIFSGCLNLTTVNIGENVTVIPAYAFMGCTGLTNITIPDSVTSINDSAFSGCIGLTSATIGSAFIGYSAFRGCSGLTSIKISNNVTCIGGYAFADCIKLTSINIPDSVTSIGSMAFSSCSGLTNINFEGTQEQWNAITKDDNWNNGVATDCTITCFDGTI